MEKMLPEITLLKIYLRVYKQDKHPSSPPFRVSWIHASTGLRFSLNVLLPIILLLLVATLTFNSSRDQKEGGVQLHIQEAFSTLINVFSRTSCAQGTHSVHVLSGTHPNGGLMNYEDIRRRYQLVPK